MVKYLLDSDVIIEFLRGKPQTISLVNKLKSEGFGCSVLTLMEVKRGVFGKQETVANKLFRAMRIYAVTKEVGDLTVEFIKEWRKRGKTLQLIDTTIAATSVLNDLILVTYNKRDYPMKELKVI